MNDGLNKQTNTAERHPTTSQPTARLSKLSNPPHTSNKKKKRKIQIETNRNEKKGEGKPLESKPFKDEEVHSSGAESLPSARSQH